MTTWIALLGNIDEAGSGGPPATRLRADLEALGFQHVRTYRHSSNLIFDADAADAIALRRSIRRLISEHYAISPDVLVLTEDEFYDAKRLNPFPRAASEPLRLHFYFLHESPANPDMRAIESACMPGERFRLIGRVFYLHAPDGLERSRLASQVGRYLGVNAIARNLRTVNKLLAMMTEAA